MCTEDLAKVHTAAKQTLDPITKKMVQKNTDKVKKETGWDADTGQRHGKPEAGDDPAAEQAAAEGAAAAERTKAEGEAASLVNQNILATSRRKRAQKNLLAGGSSVLASGNQVSSSNVLASGA